MGMDPAAPADVDVLVWSILLHRRTSLVTLLLAVASTLQSAPEFLVPFLSRLVQRRLLGAIDMAGATARLTQPRVRALLTQLTRVRQPTTAVEDIDSESSGMPSTAAAMAIITALCSLGSRFSNRLRARVPRLQHHSRVDLVVLIDSLKYLCALPRVDADDVVSPGFDSQYFVRLTMTGQLWSKLCRQGAPGMSSDLRHVRHPCFTVPDAS